MSKAYLAKVFLLAVAYVATGKVGLNLDAVSGFATLVWVPTGLSLAALLRWGLPFWPGVALGAFIVNYWTGATLFMAFGMAVGNTLEAVVGAYLLTKCCGSAFSLNRIRDVVVFIFFGAIFSTLISASFGTGVLWFTDKIKTWNGIELTWLSWWVGDVIGNLGMASLLLAWTSPETKEIWEFFSWRRPNIRLLEFCVLILTAFTACILVFGTPHRETLLLPQPYFVFPVLIWAALRFAQQGTTLVLLLIFIVAIWGTYHGLGFFARPSLSKSLLNLQTYMAFISMTSLLLASAIAERNTARLEIERRAQDLVRSNQALEQFVSFVSHDLKSPLRTISLRLSILHADHEKELNSEGLEHMSFSIRAAKRMDALIDALLQYSQTARKELRFREVDVHQELKKVVEQMAPEISRSHAKINVGDLPQVWADELLLGQVFQNLISNSIKYSGDKAPEIEIQAKETEEDWIFSVTDRGIGFAMKYTERIFEIFQRLHTQDEHSGVGIGLTLCKKIVELHGGVISAQSEIGKGSTFTFSLKKPPLPFRH